VKLQFPHQSQHVNTCHTQSVSLCSLSL